MFSPALTDGSLGDMIYFHSYKKPGLVLDIVEGIVLQDWDIWDFVIWDYDKPPLVLLLLFLFSHQNKLN